MLTSVWYQMREFRQYRQSIPILDWIGLNACMQSSITSFIRLLNVLCDSYLHEISVEILMHWQKACFRMYAALHFKWFDKYWVSKHSDKFNSLQAFL